MTVNCLARVYVLGFSSRFFSSLCSIVVAASDLRDACIAFVIRNAFFLETE